MMFRIRTLPRLVATCIAGATVLLVLLTSPAAVLGQSGSDADPGVRPFWKNLAFEIDSGPGRLFRVL